jgi:hypothetical protein
MTKESKQLVALAQQYAKIMAKHANLGDAYDAEPDYFRIHFLFPNLSGKARAEISTLAMVHSAVAKSADGGKEFRRELAQARSMVRPLFSKVTQVQREILEAVYFDF